MLTIPTILASAALLAGQTARDIRVEADREHKLADGRSRWALVIGVSTYEHVPAAGQLKYAHRDAEDFAAFLRTQSGGALPDSHLRLLTEKRASVAAIRASLDTWLPQSAGPADIVYLYLAGHGVVAERGEGYFLASDSDPQNLHATAISFREIGDRVSRGLRASLVVLFADACHSGALGQSADRASDALGAIGGDRAMLKILASRASEQSFEDERWDGGHGVFTYALLKGLRSGATSAGSLIDYVARVVPAETASRQNPRVAGNFDARTPLAAGPAETLMIVTLDLRGPAGAAISADGAFRGAIGADGRLRVEPLLAGPHRLLVKIRGGESFEKSVTLTGKTNELDLALAPEYALARLSSLISQGRVMEAGGAWDYYSSLSPAPEWKALADAGIAGALEETGQACVNDYVQSSAIALKRPMLLRAAEAYRRLKTLRPNDPAVDAKANFCLGRAQIAAGQFADAERSLRASIAIDANFACAHNALGVALAGQGRNAEAGAAFDAAARLTPNWALPYFQIAQQRVNGRDYAGAIPLLEKAVSLNPKSMTSQWNLLHVYRLAGRGPELERAMAAIQAANPNYAPAYLEFGLYLESRREFERAAQAFDTYALLAPHYVDTVTVKERAAKNRAATKPAPKKAPSLYK